MWRHQRKGTLWGEKISKALIRCRAWCVASDQGLRYFSLMDISGKHSCRSLCSVIQKSYRNCVKTADLGRHCFFRNKVPFSLMTSHMRWWARCWGTSYCTSWCVVTPHGRAIYIFTYACIISVELIPRAARVVGYLQICCTCWCAHLSIGRIGQWSTVCTWK